ncbi:hypothetical protein DL93DRAFT_1708514 [Clavulina sp. PMI_390]|nr:hypothetical protein DL93DRAFT_1708514 [Clavulina sp. PMI_390]
MPNEDSNNDIVNSANAAASLSDAVERMEIDRHGRATSVLPAVLPKLKQRTSPDTQPSSPPPHAVHTTKQDVSQPTETPPLLVEELTSSLQTIQSISEQLTVESEATSLLSLLCQTEESIQGLLAASTNNPPKTGHKKGPGKWLGLKRQRSPTGIEKEVNNALGALRDTTQSVKELHVATLERQFKRSVVSHYAT